MKSVLSSCIRSYLYFDFVLKVLRKAKLRFLIDRPLVVCLEEHITNGRITISSSFIKLIFQFLAVSSQQLALICICMILSIDSTSNIGSVFVEGLCCTCAKLFSV